MAVGIRVRLNHDGSLHTTPQIVSRGRMSDPIYRAAAESAVRAVMRRRALPIAQ